MTTCMKRVQKEKGERSLKDSKNDGEAIPVNAICDAAGGGHRGWRYQRLDFNEQ